MVSQVSFASFGPGIRLKDIVNIEGVRGNQLVGYGIVVGLNGTGDTLGSSAFTRESLISMLERLGVNIRDAASTISGKNVAAVMVTASLPPFARHGTSIDVNVSTLGDAKDLRGGILLVTPLYGADGEVYAVAQGGVSNNALNIQGAPTAAGPGAAAGQTSITKGVPTSGRISNGAIIEKEIGFEFNSLKTIHLTLRNPDFTTSKRVAEVINAHLKKTVAVAKDPGTIRLDVSYAESGPDNNNNMDLITQIEQLRVHPDFPAKIIINDQDGIIVLGENVRISTVAITSGNITIRVNETPQVSQPNPLTLVQNPTVTNRSEIKITEQKGKFAQMESGASLQEVVNVLNALGASPRDMIAILQNIKAAGALQADIEVR